MSLKRCPMNNYFQGNVEVSTLQARLSARNQPASLYFPLGCPSKEPPRRAGGDPASPGSSRSVIPCVDSLGWRQPRRSPFRAQLPPQVTRGASVARIGAVCSRQSACVIPADRPLPQPCSPSHFLLPPAPSSRGPPLVSIKGRI